jgi:hypothetical protein
MLGAHVSILAHASGMDLNRPLFVSPTVLTDVGCCHGEEAGSLSAMRLLPLHRVQLLTEIESISYKSRIAARAAPVRQYRRCDYSEINVLQPIQE